MEAIVIGATGLVGLNLVNLLIEDSRFTKIKVFVRSSFPLKHSKIEEHIIDFDKIENYKALIKGNVLFSAMGTTLKAAGSKAAQYKIDYTCQLEFAKISAENNVNKYVLVSSGDANPKARLFYSKMKGELERDVKKLPFNSTSIIKPGILTGKRKENRLGEKIGILLLKGISILPYLQFLKPIAGKIVAKAMINSVFNGNKLSIYKLGQVFALAGR